MGRYFYLIVKGDIVTLLYKDVVLLDCTLYRGGDVTLLYGEVFLPDCKGKVLLPYCMVRCFYLIVQVGICT